MPVKLRVSVIRAKSSILILCGLIAAGLMTDSLFAKSTFTSCQIKSDFSDMQFFDFDGDGLDDIILMNKSSLLFFFQMLHAEILH